MVSENKKLEEVNSIKDLNPFQSLNINKIYNNNYYIFTYKNKYIIYYIETIFKFKFAKVFYPINDLEILNEFKSFLKKNKLIYYIVSDQKLFGNKYLKPTLFTFKFNVLENKIIKGQRCNIKRAKKENLICKLLTSKKEYLEFINLYNNNNDSKSIIEKNLDYILSEISRNNKLNFYLFGVFKNNKLVSGTFYYVVNKIALFKIQVTSNDFYHLSPVPFSMEYAINYFKEKNILYIDMNVGFGSNFLKKDSKGESINKFKSKWGNKIDLYLYIQFPYNLIYNFYNKLKNL